MPYNDTYIEPLGMIHFGENARHLLNNKLPMIKAHEHGIFFVDEERWNEAQCAEEFLWMDTATDMTNDRNVEHKVRFDNYSTLQGRKFENIIELGCGPFTNVVRIPLEGDEYKITLLDPLIDKYLSHVNCAYKVKHPRLKLIRSSIEAFETNEKYDLVIMINVLEHCFNIEMIYDKLLQILSPEGLFIFSDSGTDKSEIINKMAYVYDAFHPLTFSNEWIEETTESLFDVVFKKVYNGLYNDAYRKDFYYVLKHKKRGETK